MFKLKHRCLSLLAVLFLAACANVVAPTGGPKDVTPPKVVASQPENHSTGFSGRKVEITFDEYVTLNNASQQVLVSPPLFNKPDIKLNNRTLVIKFKEDLKANTTYVLDFGQAVKDLHEGNTFKDYLFTFATGDVLDTLTLAGIVLDADTKKPVESFMVGLYTTSPHDEFGEGTLPDSIFTHPLFRAPDYLTRTDKEGHFRFIGLPDVPFLVFGIEDMNSNLYYDLPNERVAFLDTLVSPSDSVHIALSAFTATDTTQMLLENKVVEEGLLRLAFRHPADSVDIRLSWPETDTFQLVQVWNHHHDTLNCWFTPNVLDTLHAEIHYDTLINISALVNLQFRDTKPQRGKANKTLKVGTNLRNKMLMPGDDFLLRFAEPIVSCTDTCFEQADDLGLSFRLKAADSLRCTLADSTFFSVRGRTNDSISFSFRRVDDSDLSTIYIKVCPPQGKQVVVCLLDGKDHVVDQQVADSTVRVAFPGLLPDKYKLQAIIDVDRNGRLSPGNFHRRFLPEPIIPYKDAIEVKAGWDVDLDEIWEL